jgi:hypothetical protein
MGSMAHERFKSRPEDPWPRADRQARPKRPFSRIPEQRYVLSETATYPFRKRPVALAAAFPAGLLIHLSVRSRSPAPARHPQSKTTKAAHHSTSLLILWRCGDDDCAFSRAHSPAGAALIGILDYACRFGRILHGGAGETVGNRGLGWVGSAQPVRKKTLPRAVDFSGEMCIRREGILPEATHLPAAFSQVLRRVAA